MYAYQHLFREKWNYTSTVYLSRINGPNEKFINKINMKKSQAYLTFMTLMCKRERKRQREEREKF